MKTKIAVASLVSAYFVFGISVAHAESLEAFLKRSITSSVNANDFYPAGKYLIFVGGEARSFDASQMLNLHQTMKSMGAKAEILDFKILSKQETGDIVSVVAQAKVRPRVGASETVGQTVSHEILLNQGGRWISVFSVGRQ